MLFYCSSVPLIAALAWFTSFCVEVRQQYAQVDSDWILAMEPGQLNFEDTDWTIVGLDNTRFYRPGNSWLYQPYPGYKRPAGANIMPLSIEQEMKTRYFTEHRPVYLD